MKKVPKSLLKKLATVFAKDGFSFNRSSQPIQGGLIRNVCRECGGTVHTVGKGILREECSSCGKPYHERNLG
jgi:hypothetical protein